MNVIKTKHTGIVRGRMFWQQALHLVRQHERIVVWPTSFFLRTGWRGLRLWCEYSGSLVERVRPLASSVLAYLAIFWFATREALQSRTGIRPALATVLACFWCHQAMLAERKGGYHHG